jgi:hypothetical protein
MSLLPSKGDWFDRHQGETVVLIMALCLVAAL